MSPEALAAERILRLPVRELCYAPLKELDREELVRELVKRNRRLTLDLIQRVQAGDRLTRAEQLALAQCELLEPPSETVHSGPNIIEFPNK